MNYLSNPIYAALTTADAEFSLVYGLAMRFQPDIVPFAAVPRLSREALQDLGEMVSPGEEIWITLEEDQTFPATPGLEVVSTLVSRQMRYEGELPKCDDEAVVRLGEADLESMLSLKQLAYPGFFGGRAPELGTFFGIRDAPGGELVAMGGERLATHGAREISAVCTHPQHAGHGYAGRILRRVLVHQAEQGVDSFLHVASANSRAVSLYERLGFQTVGILQFVQLRKCLRPRQAP